MMLLEKYEMPNDLSIPDFLNRAAATESRAENATALRGQIVL
jgi:hypothetical protein